MKNFHDKRSIKNRWPPRVCAALCDGIGDTDTTRARLKEAQTFPDDFDGIVLHVFVRMYEVLT